MSDRSTVVASAVTTTLVFALFVGLAALGGGTASAVHPGDAQDVTEQANFTINFPYTTDHYPGDENEGNGSIQYFAVGEDAFHEMGASDGIYYDWIIVHATYDGEDWIDYSECTIDNTAAFGIDRGNNNSGTNVDDDLTTHRKDSTFRDDGIIVEFFDWEDRPAGEPPYMAPEDAIVAAQGAGSVSGPCLTLTDEPGWYRIASFANATVNDNDPDEPPTEDAAYVRFQLDSTYEYVCMCDSEEEAREQLGPPPNEPGGEPTPTDTSDDGSSDDGSGDDGSSDDGSTDDGSSDDGSGDDSADDGSGDDSADDGSGDDSADDGSGDDSADDDGGDDNSTPDADGSGFGALAALVALLAGGLLVTRRR